MNTSGDCDGGVHADVFIPLSWKIWTCEKSCNCSSSRYTDASGCVFRALVTHHLSDFCHYLQHTLKREKSDPIPLSLHVPRPALPSTVRRGDRVESLTFSSCRKWAASAERFTLDVSCSSSWDTTLCYCCLLQFFSVCFNLHTSSGWNLITAFIQTDETKLSFEKYVISSQCVTH